MSIEKLVRKEVSLSTNCLVLGEQEMSQFSVAPTSINMEILEDGNKMVSEVEKEKEKLLVPSFFPIVESFRFEENNEDHFLHNISCESHPLVCAQVEYETYKFEEDNREDDVQSTVLESFSFVENAKLSILDELYIDEKARTCFDEYHFKSKDVIEEVVSKTDFKQRPLMAN